MVVLWKFVRKLDNICMDSIKGHSSPFILDSMDRFPDSCVCGGNCGCGLWDKGFRYERHTKRQGLGAGGWLISAE